MERVALLGEGTAVTSASLGLQPARGRGAMGSGAAEERRATRATDAEAERDRLLAALRAVKWNISQAAAQLGIPRNTLRYRMEKHGLGAGSPAPHGPKGRRAGHAGRSSGVDAPRRRRPRGESGAVGRPLGAAARDLPAGAAPALGRPIDGRPSSAGRWR